MGDEILKRVLDKLVGFNFWVALAAVAISIIIWFLSGAKNRPEQKKLIRRLFWTAIPLVVAVIAIWIYHLIPPKPFPSDVAGILVLHIAGDDSSGSLRTEFVSNLNAELAKETTGQKIEVRGVDDSIDVGNQDLDLDEAHKKARRIGEKRKALLVIWGSKSKLGETKFVPCITIVRTNKNLNLKGEYTLPVRDIYEFSLPVKYLAHFVAGYSFYDRKQYREALNHFEAALDLSQAKPEEAADLWYLVGSSHLELATRYQEDMLKHLQLAIDNFALAARYYKKANNLRKFAMTQCNLGVVYCGLPTGDCVENLQKAIAAYQAALEIFTEKDFPVDWATMQYNLCTAYCHLPNGNCAENLQKAIDIYKATLRVFTKKDFPANWAAAQDNLGLAYCGLPGDREENFQKAIAAFHAALEVFTEKKFPSDWAATQINLGYAYYNLPTGNRTENLQKAIAAYQATLRVRTKKDLYWAQTQNNLGGAYASLPTGDRVQNLKKAKECFLNALEIWKPETLPGPHQMAAENLGKVEVELKALNQN
jgi:tetratricopeptide (TPR) repeat protein